jgi:hypothetical protein
LSLAVGQPLTQDQFFGCHSIKAACHLSFKDYLSFFFGVDVVGAENERRISRVNKGKINKAKARMEGRIK